MPELLEKRRRDLEAQLESLPHELDYWEQLTQTAGFEKHHSQVVALSRQMKALNETVRANWNDAQDFLSIQRAQQDCATVQRVWDYFREKLLLRLDTRMGSYLRAADAYVWSCYEPVLKARRAANPKQPYREPPLVTFDAEVSPWAQSRRTPNEAATHGTGASLDEKLPMPIAVLGIPWSTLARLPNLAALAHETGHVIEADFGLQEAVQDALIEATKDSVLSEGWSMHWRKEVFADLFACFAAGPSSVWTLAESIPEAPFQVETRKRPSDGPSDTRWGLYPPGTLRILLNLYALRLHGHTEEADQIETYWKADYPKHAMGAYENDVKLVVQAVYAAARLPDSLCWKTLSSKLPRVRQDFLWSVPKIDEDPHNARLLVAIAGDVQRNPQGADVNQVWQRLQQYIVESRPPGVLAGQRDRTQPGAPVYLRTDEIARVLFADEPPPD